MLRIGILGAAGIAPAAVIQPARRRTDVEVVAVASRRAESARHFADSHRIGRFYSDYSNLVSDPGIDLIYNALPPSEHAKWSIAAVQAGKHVLCEKPFAMNADEAAQMLEAAESTGYRLIEAFHDRYHPLSAELDAVKASGGLGEIVSLRADFSTSNPFDPASLRHDPRLGGGSLMDLGCYPVHWVRAFMGEEPTVVRATGSLNPLGADLDIAAELQFPSGATALISSAMVEQPGHLNSSLEVLGTEGKLVVNNLVFPSRGHSITQSSNGLDRTWTVRGFETYDHQLEAIVQGLQSGRKLLTEGRDSLSNMKVIDGIYAAAGFRR
ncbi:Gfo/Idh/MocA family oxidoreductase [Pseudarthrobacter sp. NamE2]|uniref:Gfo/Idh/MocA family protein n=1 Tax=Pseudarthrobacter sp. NamE2 TaxID=2576838 RepID=UPI0010FD8D81|nr:Gfo/Idh/MocA family oxidoreductase [Pseudarthrobacter sp. NamE2]TLM86591.1 Gfo/Idh/MocA family oxidoreductase [Pseudarthrobacter sp. NamE2]